MAVCLQAVVLTTVFVELLLPGALWAGQSERDFLAHERERLRASPVYQVPRNALRVTLREAVRLTAENFGKIRAEEHSITAAEAQLDEAKARFWPVLDYEYRTAPVPKDVGDAIGTFFRGDVAWFHSLKLGVGVPLYASGKLSLLEDLAQQGITAALYMKEQELVAAVSKVRQLYYGLQLGEAVAGLLIEAIDGLSDRLQSAEFGEDDEDADEAAEMASDAVAAEAPWYEVPAVEAGAADEGDGEAKPSLSPVDQLKLQIFRAELEKRLAEVRKKQRVGMAALRVQMGLEPGTRVTIRETGLRPVGRGLESPEAYIATAMTTRPEANLVAVGREAKRLEYELERRKALPEIGVGAFFEIGRTVGTVTGVTTTDDFSHPFRFTRGGVGLQVKGRFDPHGGGARIRKKRSEYYKVRLQQALAQDGIGLEVREAYHEIRTARVEVTRAEESANVARRMLFLTKSNLDIGVGEQDDYVEALKLLLLTQGQYYEAVFQLNAGLVKLDEKIGVIPYVANM